MPTCQLVRQGLELARQHVVCGALKGQLGQGVPPVGIIASADQDEIRLETVSRRSNDLVKDGPGCLMPRLDCNPRHI